MGSGVQKYTDSSTVERQISSAKSFYLSRCPASERLTVTYIGSSQLLVRFVPDFGGAQLSIVARSTEVGSFIGTCDAVICMHH